MTPFDEAGVNRDGLRSLETAGAVVTVAVEPDSVVAGQPAKVIKKVDERTRDKTGLLKELRWLDG